MESTALQQAFDTCQNNKAAWLQRKNELAAAEQEYLRLLSGEGRMSAAWTNYAILSKSENGR
ncbi:prophage polarity suppression protein [Escherichia coli]|nr:prophage polarity suppression protein [Escherichia coli]